MYSYTYILAPLDDTTHSHKCNRFGGRKQANKQREENVSTLQAIQSPRHGYRQSDTQQQPHELKEETKINK